VMRKIEEDEAEEVTAEDVMGELVRRTQAEDSSRNGRIKAAT